MNLSFLAPMARTGAVASAALVAMLGTAPPAHATEGGTSIYPHGTEGYMVGAVPPPGVYGMLYGRNYSADRVTDNNGDRLNIPGFKATARAVVGRLAWVPGVQLLGGELVTHVIVPLVDLQVQAAGARQSKTGIGDVTTGVGLGFHHSPQLHSVVALDLFVPAGGYRRGDLANIGTNHWGFEPVYGLSHINPRGFNGDIKLGYTINGRNKDTGYTSGHELHFDYAAGWGLGNGWTLGVGGYVYKQTTNDRQGGVAVANSKGSAMSIGPNIKYDSGKGWFATVKWEREFAVKNRAQGHALWLKATIPL